MQDNWQWCSKCSGLAFFGNGALGTCPAGGQHRHDGSGNYALGGTGEVPLGQPGWRWCVRCQGLYFVGNGSHGNCPAGGAHSEEGSGDYALRSSGDGQSGWRWCVNCQGLWFSGRTVAGGAPWLGRCPAPGHDGHVSAGSGDYVLDMPNAPAAPPPVGRVVVTGLPNRPPTFLLFGEKWLQITWPPYGGDRDGASLELYEGNGTPDDRFIAELPIAQTSNNQNMFGDLDYGFTHCFAVRVRNRYGWSTPSVGCGATLFPAPAPPSGGPPPPAPPPALALFVSTNSDLDNVRLVSATWTLTDPAGNPHLQPVPAAGGITRFAHPGPMPATEFWQAVCTGRFLIWPAGEPSPPESSAATFVTPSATVAWAPGASPSLHATLTHRSPSPGESGLNTFEIS
jgi:hypothetical protein